MKDHSKRVLKELHRGMRKTERFARSKLYETIESLKYLRRSGRDIQRRISGYCNHMRDGKSGRYRYSENCPETLLASAFAILTLNLIGDLEKMTEAERKSWIAYFQSLQDEKSGIFLGPQYRDADRSSPMHTNELFLAHSSTFVMGALVVLGSKPLHPITWVREMRDPVKMRKWIENLPWDISPWVVGNWSYDMGCAMGMDFLITEDERYLEGMEAYFEWYEERQSKQTGWWDLSGKASVAEQQYGGYHTFMVYQMFDRPIPMADKMIESSLSLQAEDGMFVKQGGGGSCEDMDVIDVLVSLGSATGYKESEIGDALRKALPAILRKQNPDGGFYSNLRHSRGELGWKLCFAERGTSDLCSTAFQCFSVSLIGEFLKDKKIMDTTWHHHNTYCHCLRKQVKVR